MPSEDPTIGRDDWIVRSPDMMAAETGENTVLMSLERGSYFALADTGRDIWRRLEQPIRAGDVCRALCEAYDGAPGQIEVEALAFLGQMSRLGLIKVEQG